VRFEDRVCRGVCAGEGFHPRHRNHP
jgi:hypothetical protein